MCWITINPFDRCAPLCSESALLRVDVDRHHGGTRRERDDTRAVPLLRASLGRSVARLDRQQQLDKSFSPTDATEEGDCDCDVNWTQMCLIGGERSREAKPQTHNKVGPHSPAARPIWGADNVNCFGADFAEFDHRCNQTAAEALLIETLPLGWPRPVYRRGKGESRLDNCRFAGD